MPFLAPDVIKLDLRLVQERPTTAAARIMHAVSAEAERSGAVVVAEGIETAEHVEPRPRARRRARPGLALRPPGRAARGLPAHRVPAHRPRAALAALRHAVRDRRRRARPVRRGTKDLLLAISREIETRAAQEGEEAVLLATFQDARHFTARSAARYAGSPAAPRSSARSATASAPRRRPASAAETSPPTTALRAEWNVVVIAPALRRRLRRPRPRRPGPRPASAASTSRSRTIGALAVQAAESLMARITPLG